MCIHFDSLAQHTLSLWRDRYPSASQRTLSAAEAPGLRDSVFVTSPPVQTKAVASAGGREGGGEGSGREAGSPLRRCCEEEQSATRPGWKVERGRALFYEPGGIRKEIKARVEASICCEPSSSPGWVTAHARRSRLPCMAPPRIRVACPAAVFVPPPGLDRFEGRARSRARKRAAAAAALFAYSGETHPIDYTNVARGRLRSQPRAGLFFRAEKGGGEARQPRNDLPPYCERGRRWTLGRSRAGLLLPLLSFSMTITRPGEAAATLHAETGIPDDYLLRIHSVYEQEAPSRASSFVPEAGVVPRDEAQGCGTNQDGRRMGRREAGDDHPTWRHRWEEKPANSREEKPARRLWASRNVAHRYGRRFRGKVFKIRSSTEANEND
ncbi:hypothetical protein MTO96_031703 [Rhipicephalus appendiculatus]